MLTRRVELRVTPEVRDALECARGDVALNRWVTRAIQERLQAEGYELDLDREPAEVVPIRPGIKAALKQPKPSKAKADQPKHRQRPTGTWRSKRTEQR